jgi:hypothetical protein
MSSNLADYFRSQAEWRDAKAERYPEDERNAQSAAALRSLADYVEPVESIDYERPSGEHVLSVVPDVEKHLQGVAALGGERARRAVSRYGFGHPVTSHELFLQEDLLPLCYADAYDHAAEHDGDDPTGALHDFEVKAAKDGIYVRPGYWRSRDRSTVAEREKAVQEARTADAAQEGGE